MALHEIDKPMKQHSITLETSEGSFRLRLALNMTSMTLSPLQIDERISVLMTLLAKEVVTVADSDDEIDIIINMLRLNLKLARSGGAT
ncbi:hypothetical protein ABIF78_007673 [Bradyrhizobium japonicum]